MKVLVTGGAGYIAVPLIERLLNWNDGTGRVVSAITAVDNLYRKPSVFAGASLDKRFQFIRADVTEQGDFMDDLYREHDVILPLAGLVGMYICNKFPGKAWATNYAVVADMMLSLRGNKIKVIVPTSISGYGNSEAGEALDETAILKPVSVYGQSKIKAEECVLQEGGVSLRLSTVFGPAPCMRLDLLVNNFAWDGYSRRNIVLFDKGARRCYLHVMDAVESFIFAIENYDKMAGEAYNVGLRDANLTKEDLAKIVARHTECHIVEAEFAVDEDKRDYFISSDKIGKLGFTPQYSVEEGIQQLLRFYKSIDVDSANIFHDNW